MVCDQEKEARPPKATSPDESKTMAMADKRPKKKLAEIQAVWKELGKKNPADAQEAEPTENKSTETNLTQATSVEIVPDTTETEAAAKFIRDWLQTVKPDELPPLDFTSDLDFLDVVEFASERPIERLVEPEEKETDLEQKKPVHTGSMSLDDQGKEPFENNFTHIPELAEEAKSATDSSKPKEFESQDNSEVAVDAVPYDSSWVARESSLLDQLWYTLEGAHQKPPTKPQAKSWKYIEQEEVWHCGQKYVWKGSLHTVTEDYDSWETCEPYLVQAEQLEEQNYQMAEEEALPNVREGREVSEVSPQEVMMTHCDVLDRRSLEERAAEIPFLQEAMQNFNRPDSGIAIDSRTVSVSSLVSSAATEPLEDVFPVLTYSNYDEMERAEQRKTRIMETCPTIAKLPREAKETVVHLLALPRNQRPRRWYVPPGPKGRLELHLIWDLPKPGSEE
jgi:hypothetical protein